MTREIDWSRSLKRNLHTWRGSKRRPKSVKSVQTLSPKEYLTQWPFLRLFPTMEKAWFMDKDEEKERVHAHLEEFRSIFEEERFEQNTLPDPLLDAVAFYCFDIISVDNAEKQFPACWFQAGLGYTLEVVCTWPKARPIVRSRSRESFSKQTVEELQRNVLQAIRRQLVSLGKSEYEDVLASAREHFEDDATPLSTRVHLCYLFPDQTEWANRTIDAMPELTDSMFEYNPDARADLHFLMFASGADLDHMMTLAKLCNPLDQDNLPSKVILQSHVATSFTSFYATLDRFELEARRPLLEFLKFPWSHPPTVLVDVLCHLPHEEVIQQLVESWSLQWILPANFRGFLIDHPAIALEALEAKKNKLDAAQSIGSALEQVYAELVQVEKRVEAEAAGDFHFATREDLEGVLANPPWHGEAKKKASKKQKIPKELANLELLDDTITMSNPEQYKPSREQYDKAQANIDFDEPSLKWRRDKRELAQAYIEGKSETVPPLDVFRHISLEVADKLVHKLPIDHLCSVYVWEINSWRDFLCVRPELFKPWVSACTDKETLLVVSKYINWPGVAAPMAELLATKTLRDGALAWIEANPRDAAIGAIPAYFKTRGAKKKANLEEMMRVARATDREVFDEVVAGYPAAVLDHLPSFEDAAAAYPKKMPKLPSFWNPAAYPPILLEKDLSKKLPVEICDDIALMLKFSPPGKPYVGLTELIEQADETSLGQFTWGLFESWIAATCPLEEEWVIQALALFGGPQVADELPYQLDVWLRTTYYKRSEKIIDAFAEGANAYTFEALWRYMNGGHDLDAVKAAREKVLQISGIEDADTSTIFDRVAPTFGISREHTLALGGRDDLEVWLDEDLEPHLEGVDIEELDESLRLRWERLGKLCARQARFQSRRFERAMRQQRSWGIQTWRADILEHPLLGMLAHKLLWGVYDDNGALISTFRIDETGGLVDIEDELFGIDEAPERCIQLVHPIQLPEDTLRAWSQVFTDYEIIQPFEQLSRQVWTFEAANDALEDLSKPFDSTFGAVQRLYEDHNWRDESRKRTHPISSIKRSIQTAHIDKKDTRKNLICIAELEVLGTKWDRLVPGTKPDSKSPCKLQLDAWWKGIPRELSSPVDLSELVWEVSRVKNHSSASNE
jgi:hypothetical protein